MKWLGVMPWVHKPYRDECVKTMHPDFRKNLLEVDNSEVNRGIMWAHNQGLELAQKHRADWLIIISAAIRFGEAGGMDFIEELEKRPDHHVVHAVGPKPDERYGRVPFGWHLVGMHRKVFETVGIWDENFSPYGLDDIDLGIRIRKGIPDVKWTTAPCDVSDTTHSHSISIAGVKSAYPPRNEYFKRKWGREGGEWKKEAYDHPFNDSTKPLSYWPKPDDPLSIHQVEFKSGEWTYDQ